MKTVTTKRPLEWQYDTTPMAGVCRLGGTACELTLTLRCSDRTEYPDVEEIDRVCLEQLQQTTTAEEFAEWAADTFGLEATVTLTSLRHGPIVCTATPQ